MDTREAFSAFRHQIWITCAVHFRVHYSIWKAAVKEIGTRSTKNTMDIKNIKAVVTNKPQSDYYIHWLLQSSSPLALTQRQKTQNYLGWKISFRSYSPTVNLTLRSPPLNSLNSRSLFLQAGSFREVSRAASKWELSQETNTQGYSCPEQSISHSTSSDRATWRSNSTKLHKSCQHI